MTYVELTEEELNEMGYGSERGAEHAWASSGNHKPVAKSKYHVKNKTTGKIVSTHASAPDAVRARAKIGGHDTHAIIKEETSLMEQVKELINAIEAGKSVAIESTFNEIMASKMVDAIDTMRNNIATNLFNVREESVDEAVVPGSVKKDKSGNVLSAKTVPDAHPGVEHAPAKSPNTSKWAKDNGKVKA